MTFLKGQLSETVASNYNLLLAKNALDFKISLIPVMEIITSKASFKVNKAKDCNLLDLFSVLPTNLVNHFGYRISNVPQAD